MATGAGAAMVEAATTTRYTIDARVSRFTVKVFAGGALSALGHSPTIAIGEFSGEIDYAADRIEDSRLVMKIKADSLAVTDDISAKDRNEIEMNMRQAVLETTQFPLIGFESSAITADRTMGSFYRLTVVGNLTLHGMVRPKTVVAQVALLGDSIRASGEFTVLQSEFGIRQFSAVGGTLKVKDELKLTFDIVARKAG